jgi:polysaccharide export outer membrane protein
MNTSNRILAFGIIAGTAIVLSGCNSLPASGFLRSDAEPESNQPNLSGIQIVDVTDSVARQLFAQRATRRFSEAFTPSDAGARTIGYGDGLEVSIWEAPPATLFSPATLDVRGTTSATRATTLPDQMVNSEGYISVPFAGKIKAAGQSLQAVEAEIVQRLTGKANQPEVFVRLTRNVSSNVTVVGEVTNSTRLPLTPGGERLLDALAAAGGVRQPVNKMTIQITRGDNVFAMPLDSIIRDPKQNVLLSRGDVVTAMFQPLSFTALGATGKNEEINFEAQGISLAQALARTGGLRDERSDPQGIFIFRFEPANALAWPKQPLVTTADGKVAVIYRIDMKDPASFFVAQTFQLNNKDLLYVSNAPVAELQKFLNVVFSVAYPVLNAVQATK